MKRLSNYINSISELNDTEKAKLNYILSCLVCEGSKLLLFFLYFGSIHKFPGILYSLMLLLPLRMISGGLHFKHYTSCLIFSFMYLYLVNLVLMLFKLSFGTSVLILFLCVVINCKIGPIRSPNRPRITLEQHKKGQLYILFATTYELLLTALFFDTHLSTIGFWTIVLHTVQLIIAKLIQKRGDRYATTS